MSTTPASSVAGALADAVAARDFSGCAALLDPRVDFRGMTPNRDWEAGDPAEVTDVLRTWLEHPDRRVTDVTPTDPEVIADTARVGWLVRGDGQDGPFVFQQQAYVRERDGRITWLRVMCTGPRPT